MKYISNARIVFQTAGYKQFSVDIFSNELQDESKSTCTGEVHHYEVLSHVHTSQLAKTWS